MFVFCNRISFHSPICPEIHYVDLANLKLRNPPAFTFQVLGLEVYPTMPGSNFLILMREGENPCYCLYFSRQHKENILNINDREMR